jgi:hypothetical protein
MDRKRVNFRLLKPYNTLPGFELKAQELINSYFHCLRAGKESFSSLLPRGNWRCKMLIPEILTLSNLLNLDSSLFGSLFQS